MLPADEHDPGQLRDAGEHSPFVADPVRGDRHGLQPPAQRRDGFPRPSARTEPPSRWLMRVRGKDDVGRRVVGPSTIRAEQCCPCTRTLPSAKGQRMFVFLAFDSQARAEIGVAVPLSGFLGRRMIRIVSSVDIRVTSDAASGPGTASCSFRRIRGGASLTQGQRQYERHNDGSESLLVPRSWSAASI
jgi:hypothetical protein